jgi:hypothetical protein
MLQSVQVQSLASMGEAPESLCQHDQAHIYCRAQSEGKTLSSRSVQVVAAGNFFPVLELLLNQMQLLLQVSQLRVIRL